MTVAVGLKPDVVLQPLIANTGIAIARVIVIVTINFDSFVLGNEFLFDLEFEKTSDISIPNNVGDNIISHHNQDTNNEGEEKAKWEAE